MCNIIVILFSGQKACYKSAYDNINRSPKYYIEKKQQSFNVNYKPKTTQVSQIYIHVNQFIEDGLEGHTSNTSMWESRREEE